jgi:FMN phosphatase YigB (HAD superfamily)
VTRAVLADLGKVLVGFDHQVTCDRIAEATGIPAGRLRPVLFGDLEANFDRGRLTPHEFFRACEEGAGLPRLPDSVWTGAWRDIFHPLRRPRGLSRIRPGIGGSSSRTRTRSTGRVLRVFDPRALDALVLSFQVGAVKPEGGYRDAALAARCAPGECLYADDRPELVDAAAARGIPGFVVGRPGSFAAGLEECGLLESLHAPTGNSRTGMTVPLS